MSQNEISAILDNILIENDFWFSEISECREQNAEILNDICSIFDVKKSLDFTLLIAAIQLLSNESEQSIKYFVEDNGDLAFSKTYKAPTRKELMIVATAFLDNPLFFSKCWNMVAIIENEIASSMIAEEDNSNNSITNFIIDYDMEIEELKYAASGDSEGFGENITKIPVENIGELEILGESDTQQIVFDFFIAEEYQTKKFELTVEYEVNGAPFTAVLRNDFSEPQAVISTEPIDVDFSLGLKIKKISCKPL